MLGVLNHCVCWSLILCLITDLLVCPPHSRSVHVVPLFHWTWWGRLGGSGRGLWSRLQSPLRILSDAPKFRAECLQTLRDGEVEEESAAPPSIYTTITTPLVHDFIINLTGDFGPR